jgi:hypothetical protein
MERRTRDPANSAPRVPPHNPSHGPDPEEEHHDEPTPLPEQASRTPHQPCHRARASTLSNHTRTCNKLPDVHMYTSEPVLRDMDRGTLARIDRRLLSGLGDDEAYRTVRVPATGGKWSTWKRYCDSVGVSMGRAVTMLIDRELVGVFGDVTGDESPVFAQRATEQLATREAKIVAREREVGTEEARMRERSERLRRWEDALGAREQRAKTVSNLTSPHSTGRVKIGRNERCPCGSGLKYKLCHGAGVDGRRDAINGVRSSHGFGPDLR